MPGPRHFAQRAALPLITVIAAFLLIVGVEPSGAPAAVLVAARLKSFARRGSTSCCGPAVKIARASPG